MGLVLCATSDSMTTGVAERFAFSSVLLAVAGTTRLGELPLALPRWVARHALPRRRGKPAARTRWAASEVYRTRVRMRRLRR